MKIKFDNIDNFYNSNRSVLLDDKTSGSLRPSKSVTRDAEATVKKFLVHYNSKGASPMNEVAILGLLGLSDTNDTYNTNIRTMLELKLMEKNASGDYEFLPAFVKLASTGMNPGAYILEKMYSIKSVDDLTMYFNTLLCVLREGYIYDEILNFPEGAPEFISLFPNKSDRDSFRERAKEIYGFTGRAGHEQDDYSPNPNYRVITELQNLHLIEQIQNTSNKVKTYKLTSNAYHLLATINRNLSKEKEENDNCFDEPSNEYERAAKMLLDFQQETGFEIPEQQDDIDAIRNEFMNRYSPDKLEQLSGDSLLSGIFYTSGDNSNALCYWIERNVDCRAYFGSIAGGSAYKFGLFQKSDTGVWTTGSAQKPQELSEEEALALGTEIRDALVKSSRIIENATLKSLEDYEKLDDDLRNQIGDKFFNWGWFHKCLAIIHPDKLSCFHSTEWQNHILYGCGIKPSDKYYARSGQISMIENYAGLSYRRFFSLAKEKFGRPKSFVRIGTSNGEKDFITEWSQHNVVALGWNNIGSLENFVSGDTLDKTSLSNELEEKYYTNDKNIALRKAGEIIRFYKTDEDTIFVAMSGQKPVAFADEVGAYFFDINSEMAHSKPAKWHLKFSDTDALPNDKEGLQTSCYTLTDVDNLLYLYRKYYFEDSYDDTQKFDYHNKDLEEREKAFIAWMRKDSESKGEKFNEKSKKGYAYALRKAASKIDGYNYASDNLFYYSSEKEMEEISDFIRNASNFNEVNYYFGNGQLAAGLSKYIEFLKEVGDSQMYNEYVPVIFKTRIAIDQERNRIVFGAPGTGKSFAVKEDCENLMSGTEGTYERVTFHPEYSYSQFVGTYKPVMNIDGKSIRYDFVPGPFMRVYVDALKTGRTGNPQPHLLIIEEINRAKVAAVFGDVFQLLDRDDDGVSVYEIQATEDIRRYLAKELGGVEENYKKIRIHNNMFIWSTMNSADQGVFPMDTAFKRRWNFEYLGIDENESQLKNIGKVRLPGLDEPVEWNNIRKAINAKMSSPEFKVNEDKLMGPFFMSLKVLESDENGEILNQEKFIKSFKSKVIMYLYEDAVKQGKHRFFEGCDSSKYSSVCDAFDEMGLNIFGSSFKETFLDQGD